MEVVVPAAAAAWRQRPFPEGSGREAGPTGDQVTPPPRSDVALAAKGTRAGVQTGMGGTARVAAAGFGQPASVAASDGTRQSIGGLCRDGTADIVSQAGHRGGRSASGRGRRWLRETPERHAGSHGREGREYGAC